MLRLHRHGSRRYRAFSTLVCAYAIVRGVNKHKVLIWTSHRSMQIWRIESCKFPLTSIMDMTRTRSLTSMISQLSYPICRRLPLQSLFELGTFWNILIGTHTCFHISQLILGEPFLIKGGYYSWALQLRHTVMQPTNQAYAFICTLKLLW